MKKIFTISMIIFIFATCSSPAPSLLTLKFSNSEFTVNANNSFEVGIVVKNVNDLFACSMEITYDESVIDYQSGSLFKGNCWNGEVYKFERKESNKVNICVGLVNTGSFSGEGELFTLRFLALTPYETSISFENVTLIKEDGQMVSGIDAIQLRDGYVIVQ